jgi:branched-chain amino acid transport system ATP-binding protein
MAEALLQVEGLNVGYAGVPAVQRVSFTIMPGEALAVLGANGAGKSSILRAIAGLHRPTAGRVIFAGKSLPFDARRHALAGIGYSPEGRRPFPGLTVRENLDVAGRGRPRDIDRAFALFPALAARSGSLGWQLSGGEAQMLAIARALMLEPQLLLLDEPSLGLAPRIVGELTVRLREIVAGGTAILVAEEKAAAALSFSHRAIVLRRGRIADSGSAVEMGSERIRKAYFGL